MEASTAYGFHFWIHKEVNRKTPEHLVKKVEQLGKLLK